MSDFTLLAGQSVTGAEILRKNWSDSSLGLPHDWPVSLRTTLSLMLACPRPMFLAWGPELLCFYNDAYRPILGYRVDTALGRPFREVWASIWTDIEPLVEATLEGRSQVMTDMPLDLSREGKPEESWWTFTYSPAYDDAGRVTGLLCVTGETTDRILAERARRDADERLNLALSAGNGIGVWDWDVVKDWVTADARFSALYGVDPVKGASGAPIGEFFSGIHPEDLPRVRNEIETGIRNGGVFRSEYRLSKPDGSVRWVTAQGQCVYDEEGRCIRFPGASYDISDRVAAEAATAAAKAERDP